MIEEQVLELLGPTVASVGAELVDVEWNNGNLKLTVDAEGGISTKTLTKVTRLVSPIIEQQQVIKSEFGLEVSSPGLERSLKKPDHFVRAVGSEITVKLAIKEPPHRLQGTLVSADDNGIVLEAAEVDGKKLKETQTHNVEHSNIFKAKTVFDWKAALSKKQ